jgi:hypothetical protein
MYGEVINFPLIKDNNYFISYCQKNISFLSVCQAGHESSKSNPNNFSSLIISSLSQFSLFAAF